MKNPLLCFLFLWFGGLIQAGEPPSLRENVQRLVEGQMKSWETGDEEAFLATLHARVIFAYPGKRLAREDALKVFQDWKRDFRDTRLAVKVILIDGPRFSIEYLFSATNRTDGTRMAVGTVATGEVRDGRLIIWKEYLDGRVSRLQAKGELGVDDTAEPFPWPDTPESRRL